MSRTRGTLISHTRSALSRLREDEPLVHAITNSVVTGFTANALLSLGASVAVVDIPQEAGPFARVASGLLVNLGTPAPHQRDAAREAVEAAVDAGTPWVLDPVAVGSLPVRTALASELVERHPSVVRGNASEILAVSGKGTGGRGTDADAGVDDAREAAHALARRTGAAVAVSGPTDLITDGEDDVRLGNGTPLLTRITGGGCVLGAIMAAFAGDSDDPLSAAVTGTLVYTVAAEIAAERAPLPGSFLTELVDCLHTLDADALTDRAMIRIDDAAPEDGR